MIAKKQHPFQPDYAIPPGATLEETMQARGWTQRELADRTGLSVQTLNRIFKGDQPISYETANRLELVTGTPASFWNNLEALYREQLVKMDEARQSKSNLEWLKGIPVKELIARSAVVAVEDKALQLREVLRFYGVSSVEAWHTIWDQPAAAARKSTCFASAPGPTSAWLRLGQLEAQGIACSPYDKRRFVEALGESRKLTGSDPQHFIPEMKRLCAEAGVAFVLVPELAKAPWSGAAEWLSSTKAMLLLNIRGRTEDRFWFSFFHEASHILNDSKKETHVDDCGSYADDPVEKQADDFAAETLIPRKHDPAVRAVHSAVDVKTLAGELGISPGIVVGRYQYLTQRWSHFNGLKKHFEWSAEAKG